MKLHVKTLVLTLAVSAAGLLGAFAPVANASARYTVVADWTNATCPASGHACLVYYMEIRHDLTNGTYYAWAQIGPGNDQPNVIQVSGMQIDRINLGNNTRVLRTVGPVHSTNNIPIAAASTPEVLLASGTRAQLAERLYYSVRYSDNTLKTGHTGLLRYGQKNY